jgi:AcrR family transcriptional regulator
MATEALFEETDDTCAAIMKATYDALCEHGYAELTIQRIGDEFPKSKSLVYHHYDGKDELLLDLLEFMLDRFETSVPRHEYADAAAHLEAILDHVVPDALDDDRREFISAIVELRAQAAHDSAYNEHFTRHIQFFHERFVTVVERGIEEGVFRDVDPERVAAFLLTTVEGAMLQRVTVDVEASMPAVREELRRYVETRLLADNRSAE